MTGCTPFELSVQPRPQHYHKKNWQGQEQSPSDAVWGRVAPLKGWCRVKRHYAIRFVVVLLKDIQVTVQLRYGYESVIRFVIT
jgi:hypothetical protein